MDRPHRHARPACLLVAAVLAAACSSTAQGNPTGAVVAASGHRLILELSTCNAQVEGEVDEQPDEVVVTITVTGGTMDDCADVFEVSLDEPLGDRPVVNAHSGQPIPTRTAGP